MADHTEVIKELQEKVSKYEKLLEKMLSKESVISKVVAGPEKHNNKDYYRVSMGGGERLLTSEIGSFFDVLSAPKVGDEVVVAGNVITSVIPKGLEPKQEKIPTALLVTWEQIGGMKSQLKKIRAALEGPMNNRALAEELGLKPIKGIALYGPPGCGKTLIAKAVAHSVLNQQEVEADAFVYMKGPEVLSPYVGVAEGTIRATFDRTRKYSRKTGKRAVIFIDEAEAILPARGSRFSSDVDSTIVPSFLAEMDGFDDNSPIVILATNRPENLDEAVLRPGRIDLKVEVARPNQTDVHEIFGIHSKSFKLADKGIDIATLGTKLMFSAETFSKVSGAMVNTMLNLAANNALTRRLEDKKAKLGITVEDIEESYNSIKSKY